MIPGKCEIHKNPTFPPAPDKKSLFQPVEESHKHHLFLLLASSCSSKDMHIYLFNIKREKTEAKSHLQKYNASIPNREKTLERALVPKLQHTPFLFCPRVKKVIGTIFSCDRRDIFIQCSKQKQYSDGLSCVKEQPVITKIY